MATITQFQLDSPENELTEGYRENGFVVVKDMISSEERSEIETDLMKINRGDYDREYIEPVNWASDDKRLLARHSYIGMPHVYSPIIERYVKHPGLCQILDHVVGAFVPFWDGWARKPASGADSAREQL